MLRGSLTALVTPVAKNGGFDEKAFRAFVDWQVAEGTSGLVPVGTTGESPTLSHDEHRQVVKVCIEVARGRVPVVAGAGSNNTEEAIGLVQFADLLEPREDFRLPLGECLDESRVQLRGRQHVGLRQRRGGRGAA